MMSILCKTRPQFPVQKLPPVFNKRLFKAQAGIVLTDKILYILQRPLSQRRSTEELHTIKPVVSALKDIHKGLQFLKEALCFVVTYEKFDADVDIFKKNGEKCLSCYYILNGSVEARYAISNGVFSQGENSPKNPNDCDINYTHVAGEYLGLVSGDGPEFDYPPPDSIRTIEVSEFIRVDREQFHRAVKKVQNKYVREIENFIEEVLALKALPTDEKKKLVAMMARQVRTLFYTFVCYIHVLMSIFQAFLFSCRVYFPRRRNASLVVITDLITKSKQGVCSLLETKIK